LPQSNPSRNCRGPARQAAGTNSRRTLMLCWWSRCDP
jgi:hypothetical protein